MAIKPLIVQNNSKFLYLSDIIDSMKQGKLIFEQSKAAKKRIFKSILDKVAERDAALGLPKIYRNQHCVKPSMFVHKYPDGRRFLIEIDTNTSEQHIIRAFR